MRQNIALKYKRFKGELQDFNLGSIFALSSGDYEYSLLSWPIRMSLLQTAGTNHAYCKTSNVVT